MKKTTLILLLAGIHAGLMAQDTANVTLCKQFWKTGEPIYGSGFGVFEYLPSDPIGDGLLYIIDSNENCLPLTYVTDNQPGGLTRCFEAWKIDNKLNGVTVLDLLAINNDIFSIKPLTSPYAQIAADLNLSGGISTLDGVMFARILLDTMDTFEAGWRFYGENCDFSDPDNPIQDGNCPCILNEEIMSWDNDTFGLVGLKIGDVDGDANPNGPYSGPVTNDTILLLFPDMVLSPGVVQIPVSIFGDRDISAIQLEFRVDTSKGAVLNMTGEALSSSSWRTFSDGRFRKFTASLGDIPGNSILFYLTLTIDETVAVSDLIRVDTTGFPSFAVDADDVTPLSLRPQYTGSVSTVIPNTGVVVEAASPNPFSDKTFIPIRLESAETIRLEVYDLAGRLLYRSEPDLPAGENRLEIPASALGAGHIGLYKISAGQQTASGKIVRQ